MKIAFVTPAGVGISLSRRNLEHLLAALDEASDAGPYIVRECIDSDGETRALRVFAEENDEHYGDREPGPGFDFLLKDSDTFEKDLDAPGPDIGGQS